jgi:death-on-curing family protein
MNNKIEIYTNKENETEISVQFKNENAWLNQAQIIKLFNRDQSVISRHISNIFKENELDKKSNMQKMHIANSDKPVDFYSLDVIISIGYRVKSKEGTKFRIWANKRLKEYLIKGCSINQKRLDELQQTIKLINNNINIKNIELDEAKGALEIIKNYNESFILLNHFDSSSLAEDKLNEEIIYQINYDDALKAITELKKNLIAKKEASDLFGKQKDNSFKGILKNILQSFAGQMLYPSIEQQASHLLYFIIKNHPFTDGNKRIGAFMFIWFLEKNKHLLKKSGELKINDNGLVTLALLVAMSDPKDKDLMIKLIINLIKNSYE